MKPTARRLLMEAGSSSQKYLISRVVKSSESLINNRDDAASSSSSSSSSSPDSLQDHWNDDGNHSSSSNTSSLTGNWSTNQLDRSMEDVARSEERQLPDPKKVARASNGNEPKKSTPHTLWNKEITERESYDDDTSGELEPVERESETSERSGSDNPSSAAGSTSKSKSRSASTASSNIIISKRTTSKQKIERTKEVLEEDDESMEESPPHQVNGGMRLKRTSTSNKPSSSSPSKKVARVLSSTTTQGNNLEKFERFHEQGKMSTTTLRVTPEDEHATAAASSPELKSVSTETTVDSLLTSTASLLLPIREFFQLFPEREQTKQTRRPKRSHYESDNSAHPHRHTTGSYFFRRTPGDEGAEESLGLYFTDRIRRHSYSTLPTWPEKFTLNSDETETNINPNLMTAVVRQGNDDNGGSSDDANLNLISPHFASDHRRRNYQVGKSSELTSPTTGFRSASSEKGDSSESGVGGGFTYSSIFITPDPLPTPSVLVPNPISDDDPANDNDDLVILARSGRQRRYGSVGISGKHYHHPATTKTLSSSFVAGGGNNNNYDSESHQRSNDNVVPDDNNNHPANIFIQDEIPTDEPEQHSYSGRKSDVYDEAYFANKNHDHRHLLVETSSDGNGEPDSTYSSTPPRESFVDSSNLNSNNNNIRDMNRFRKNGYDGSNRNQMTFAQSDPAIEDDDWLVAERRVVEPTITSIPWLGNGARDNRRSRGENDNKNEQYQHRNHQHNDGQSQIISDGNDESGSDGGFVRGSPTSWHDELCWDSPHYVVYSWVLCMVSLAAFLKLYFMVKAAIITLLFVTYSVLILWPFQEFFVPGDAGQGNK